MAYTPEVQAKIDALEKELIELKRNTISVVRKDSLSRIDGLIGTVHLHNDVHSRVSYLARLSSGAVCKDNIGRHYVKKISSMDSREISVAQKCASEIIAVMEKYLEAENGTY